MNDPKEYNQSILDEVWGILVMMKLEAENILNDLRRE
ncbi:hypothetical protein QE429_004827 [Bacillus sp. SORGH_AS 510]|nr:hypothetical protein [Bacillus sp. SORGH_AS_0510]